MTEADTAQQLRLKERLHSERLVQRYLWFVLGACINKAALGTSPISSVPYVLDLELPLSFGETTFAMNLLFIIAQVGLLRRDFKPIQLLQVAVNLLFSTLIDVSMAALSWLNPTELPLQLASLADAPFSASASRLRSRRTSSWFPARASCAPSPPLPKSRLER